MKKVIITTIITAALTATAAVAGTPAAARPTFGKGIAAPALNVPALCDCFEGNTASMSVYAGGLIVNSGSLNRGGSHGHGAGQESLSDSFAAGISMNYFFTPIVGVEGDYTFAANSSEVNLLTGSVVLRAPIRAACLAPYAVAGGGLHADGVTQGVYHAGGGVDFRLANCFGVFADARYTWAEDTEDYTIVRGGVRFNF